MLLQILPVFDKSQHISQHIDCPTFLTKQFWGTVDTLHGSWIATLEILLIYLANLQQ